METKLEKISAIMTMAATALLGIASLAAFVATGAAHCAIIAIACTAAYWSLWYEDIYKKKDKEGV